MFFQGAEEALDAPISLGLPYEGRRRLDTQEADLFLEIVAPVNTAVVVTQAQTGRRAGGKSPEVLVDALADRLQRLKPGGFLDGVDAHTFGRAVIDGGEDGHRTFGFG